MDILNKQLDLWIYFFVKLNFVASDTTAQVNWVDKDDYSKYNLVHQEWFYRLDIADMI